MYPVAHRKLEICFNNNIKIYLHMILKRYSLIYRNLIYEFIHFINCQHAMHLSVPHQKQFLEGVCHTLGIKSFTCLHDTS